jgi:hypothetical protein
MKKIIFNAFSVAMLCSITFSDLFGQLDEFGVRTFSKAQTVTAVPEKTSPPKRFSNVLLERSFVNHFKGIEDVTWKETDKEFIATFKTDNRMAIAWFTKSGRLYCTNYYGSEKSLPADEKAMIKSYYAGYEITAVVQIVKPSKTAYVVSLRNPFYCKKVKMVDGDFEEIESLRAAD